MRVHSDQGTGPHARGRTHRFARSLSAWLRPARPGTAPVARLDAVGLWGLAFGVALVASVGCGKKGPPLAPLVIVPAAVADVSAGRFGDRVVIRFAPPDKNTDNSTPADVGRVEIYAMSVASAAAAPDADALVREGARVAVVDLAKGTAAAGEGQPPGPRLVTETLDAETLAIEEPTGSRRSRGATGPARPASATATSLNEVLGAVPGLEAAMAPVPMRVYAVVPVSGRGRRGAASIARIPLAPAPAPPAVPAIAYTETATSLTWTAVDGVDGYNVYETAAASPGSTDPEGSAGLPGAPVNESPLGAPAFEDKRVEFGKKRCYRLTSVDVVEDRRIESVMSDEACVTPVDTFAPAPPTGVAAVAGPGTISLIWDAASAADLAGYVVLRGELPGDTLQALTPEPIKETTFSDATVTPGVRYVYAVVAVDGLKNMSAQSARVEETAR